MKRPLPSPASAAALALALLGAAGPAAARHAPVEGFGAVTTGGAGKPACVVTSLADRGPGTLRACLAFGGRQVVFAVAGEIELESALVVMGGHVTIDGFTAPAPGITLRGHGLALRRGLPGEDADAHDVIVRGLRIRSAALGDESADCIGIYGEVYNVVIDHVSIFRCGDGGIDISGGPRDVTVQWSIVSADKVMLLGATSSSLRLDTRRLSLHHNVVPEGIDRMPLVRPAGHQATETTVDIRHNVFRGWRRSSGTKLEAGTWANLVGNTYIPRPDKSPEDRAASVRIDRGTRVYTAGNAELGEPPAPDYNRYGSEPAPLPAPPVTPHAAGCVVAHAGMRPLDDVDARLLAGLEDLPCPGSADRAAGGRR